MEKKVIPVLLIALLIVATIAVSCSQPLPSPPAPQPIPEPKPAPTPSETPTPTPTPTTIPPLEVQWNRVLETRSVSQFVVDSNGPQTIIYAIHIGGPSLVGVWESADLGQTWEYLGKKTYTYSTGGTNPSNYLFNRVHAPDIPDPERIDSEGRVWSYASTEDERFVEVRDKYGKVSVKRALPDFRWRFVKESEVREDGNVTFGIYESQDGGDTWVKIGMAATIWREESDVKDWQYGGKSYGLGPLVVEPTKSDTAYIVIRGIPTIWFDDARAHGQSVQILRTAGAGESWELLSPIRDEGAPDAIFINRLSPLSWYVVQSGSLWKSTDGGNSWEPLINRGDRSPYRVWGKLWETFDNETAWQKAWETIPQTRTKYWRYPLPLSTLPSPAAPQSIGLAVDPNNFDNLLLTIVDGPAFPPDTGPNVLGGGGITYNEKERYEYAFRSRLFISTNGGTTWLEIATPPIDEGEAQELVMKKRKGEGEFRYSQKPGVRLGAASLISSQDSLILLVSSAEGIWRARIESVDVHTGPGP